MPAVVKEEGPQLEKGEAPEESEESASTDSGQELGAEARGLRPGTYGDRTESKAYGSVIHKCEVQPQGLVPTPLSRSGPSPPVPLPPSSRPAPPSHPAPSRRIPCALQDCGKEFTHTGNFKRHIRIHTGEKPFSCSECSKAFSDPAACKAHEKTHRYGTPSGRSSPVAWDPSDPLLSLLISSPLKPYGCEECGKSYRLISLLNLHKKRHSGEARYRCEDCGKLFTTSGNLKRHQLVHSGEKPYQCDYCGRSFSDPTSKMRHLETHDTDKEHKCPHCDKKFNQVCGRHPGRCRALQLRGAGAAPGQRELPPRARAPREDTGRVGGVGGWVENDPRMELLTDCSAEERQGGVWTRRKWGGDGFPSTAGTWNIPLALRKTGVIHKPLGGAGISCSLVGVAV